jgi:hypothetical protein
MTSEMIICVPGTWKSRTDFVTAIVATSNGEFMPTAMVLAHPKSQDHVEFEFNSPYDQMGKAFGYAGQGKLSDETLNKIAAHKAFVYLRFPLDIAAQRLRLVKFTKIISRCGGLAVKIENCGIAHEWERWFSLLDSDNPFDTYCAVVILIQDKHHYYSCGMQCFGLPDAQVSEDFNIKEAAELMNQFNYYRIVTKTSLESGHTFSLTADSAHVRIELVADERHAEDDLFHNPHGLWDLTQV